MVRHFIVLLFFSLLLAGCSEDDEFEYVIDNQSSEKIFVSYQTAGENLLSAFADPTNDLTGQIEANSPKKFYNYEYGLREGRALSILFVTQGTIDANSWQDILDNELFEKRIDLTLNELAAAGYKISYP